MGLPSEKLNIHIIADKMSLNQYKSTSDVAVIMTNSIQRRKVQNLLLNAARIAAKIVRKVD